MLLEPARVPSCAPRQPIYRERRQTLVDAIRQYGDGVLEVSDEGGAGMYLVAWLRAGVDDRSAAEIASAAGVDTVPLLNFALCKVGRAGLVLAIADIRRR